MNMKKIWIILPLVLVSLCMISCGDDDEGGTREDPVTTTDPEGTIVANLLNNNNDSRIYMWGSYYDGIKMNSANNLATTSTGVEIVSVGSVKGLSSITKVPDTGWSYETAAIPGYGYVVRQSSRQWDASLNKYVYEYKYVRLYVIDYMESTSGGIMGCTIKYQIWEPDKK